MRKLTVVFLGMLVAGIPLIMATSHMAVAQVMQDPEEIFEDNPARRQEAIEEGRTFVPDISALGPERRAGAAARRPGRRAAAADGTMRFVNRLPRAAVEEPNATAGAVAAGDSVFQFGSMVGLPEGFTGMPLGGLTGAGAPWTIESGSAGFGGDGSFSVQVTGLVLTESGANPLNEFGAAVSCSGAGGEFSVVRTANFPADVSGNASHEEVLELPSPCFLPQVFVTTPDGRWIAAGGR